MRMHGRVGRWVLTTGWLGGLALALAILPLGIAADAVSADPAGSVLPFASGISVLAAFTMTVGFILSLRAPGNRVGTLQYVGGLLLASVLVAWMATVLLEASNGPSDVLAGLTALWGYVMLPIAVVLAFTAVGVYFPDGHLPGSRWRIPVGALVGALVVSLVITAFTPFPAAANLALNPIAMAGIPVALSELANILTGVALIGSFVAATIATIVRWRRSQGIERAQMKWFAAGFSIAMTLFTVSWGSDIGGNVIDTLSVMGMSLIPIAIGIAVLRYRLYEIDRLISRTIGWAIVTGLLVAVFGAGLLGLQALLAGVTQGQTLAVAASTLVAFALFQPLRRLVQRTVDRRFDRSRYDGERVAATFAEQLRQEVDLGHVSAGLVAAAHSTVRPATASIWLRGGRA
ncbi:MAG: hypothetical protein OEW06_05230 [Gemmatimonadota bacterium]|nr:hypothetical protein [Gemmatimonadota bacterium]